MWCPYFQKDRAKRFSDLKSAWKTTVEKINTRPEVYSLFISELISNYMCTKFVISEYVIAGDIFYNINKILIFTLAPETNQNRKIEREMF